MTWNRGGGVHLLQVGDIYIFLCPLGCIVVSCKWPVVFLLGIGERREENIGIGDRPVASAAPVIDCVVPPSCKATIVGGVPVRPWKRGQRKNGKKENGTNSHRSVGLKVDMSAVLWGTNEREQTQDCSTVWGLSIEVNGKQARWWTDNYKGHV